ncbi:MAG: 16S rRNA (cytosine(967)-C(5))-methyltransferase RsmB [Gammaproteobacteria bacterium]|nr:16S rRNA (cytosine(967)-C(5))-methyltransferase RsmB [Gammaproteobacteria bacterium]
MTKPGQQTAASATDKPSPATIRAQSARVVCDVLFAGHFLDRALETHGKNWPAADKALMHELCYGAIRYGWRLLAVIEQLLAKPLKEKDGDIEALILIGLYQLVYMRTPSHAAINETVQATRKLKKPWAAGLVNACLRNYERQKAQLDRQLDQDPVSQYSHPLWLIEALTEAWPDHVDTILNANNVRPPMWIRVNQAQCSVAEYAEKLTQAQITHRHFSGTGMIVDPAKPVAQLPGFDSGMASVQDGAAQFAAIWLDAQPGNRVLDACAAPGGKLAHIGERETRLSALVAVEKEPRRIPLIESTLTRTGVVATVIEADAAAPASWWDGTPFDRILVDAPCSATGVIRRNPDIRFHRQARDIVELAAVQTQILDALWPCLAKGGKLLYATCSILPQENDEQIRAFLERHADATPVKLEAAPTTIINTPFGKQWLPGMEEMDGFYYACITKR